MFAHILWLPKKGVADLWLYQLQCTCICMCTLRASRYVRSYKYVCIAKIKRRAHGNRDEQFLLVKLFPTLIHQNFPLKICAIWYIILYTVKTAVLL